MLLAEPVLVPEAAPSVGRQQPEDFGLGVLFQRGLNAVVVADVEAGSIVLWNPAAERMFGYSAEEAVGQPIEILMDEGIGNVHRAGLERYRHDGRGLIIDSGRGVEVPARTKEGKDFRVELALTPIQSRTHNGSFVLGVLRDVTDRKRVELMQFELARANGARQDAEAAIAARDEFLVRLADNPSLDRLERFARALVDLKLLDAGLLMLKFEEADLAQVVRRTVGLARLRTHGHRLVMRGSICLPTLCDAVRIGEVVDNLLDNAITHNPQPCLVEVRVSRPKRDLIEIVVRDHGDGVPVERRDRLFERYCPATPKSRTAGAGLGLHLSRKLIELHGGTLLASFPHTGGVSVVITLPMRERV